MKEQGVAVIGRSLVLLLKGRAHFARQHIGETISHPNGGSYRIFRQVVIRPQPGELQNPGAVFCVWFFTRTSPAVTIAMSWLTVLFFFGMKGFRSKIWLYDHESGEFGGIYEWDTLEQAVAYNNSFAMRLSALRSIPGRFRTEMYPLGDPRLNIHASYRLGTELLRSRR